MIICLYLITYIYRRFFNLSLNTSAATPTQSKLKYIDKPGKPTDSDDAASPKVKKASVKGAVRGKPVAPENDGSDSNERDTKAGVSSEMEVSDTSEPAIHSSKEEKALRNPSTKRARPTESRK